MLQMYYASLYLKVNGEVAGKLLGGVKLRDDKDDLVELVLNNVSWKELYDEIIDGKASHCMYVGNTFWKKRPYISATAYLYGENIPKYFEDDTSKFTIAWVYTLDKHYTVSSVLKHAKADQAVQWFKERGLSVCPLQ